MTQLPHGWVKIRGASFWRLIWSAPTRPAGYGFLLVLVGVQFALNVGIRVIGQSLGQTAAWITIGALAVGLAALFVVAATRNQTPSFNFDESLMRVDTTVVPFDQITDASYLTIPSRRGDTSYLRLGKPLSPGALVCVRSGREPEATDDERELVAEVLRRSPVAIPETKPDPYDPTGKFAWMDHPDNLTQDEAIEYVLRTPESGEPVRAAARPKSIWIDED